MEITEDFKIKLRDFILEEIKSKGLSQTKYANKIGINGGYISMIKDKYYWNEISKNKWNEIAFKTGFALDLEEGFSIDWKDKKITRDIKRIHEYFTELKALETLKLDEPYLVLIRKGLLSKLIDDLNNTLKLM